MSTNKPSVVRYRYKTACFEWNLRDDLHSSEEGSDCEFTSDTESENETFPAETVYKTPDVWAEQDSSQPNVSDHDDDPINNEQDLADDNDGSIDAHNNVDRDDEANDCDDGAMKSRCGAIVWKRECPSQHRYGNQNILIEDRGIPEEIQFGSIAEAFKIFIDEEMVRHILVCTNLHANDIKTTSSRTAGMSYQPKNFTHFLALLYWPECRRLAISGRVNCGMNSGAILYSVPQCHLGVLLI